MGVIVQRDDGCDTVVKGYDGGEWSSDGVVLWLRGGKMKTRLISGESDQCWNDLFIVVKGGSRVVRGG
jgi:hypothetical protein